MVEGRLWRWLLPVLATGIALLLLIYLIPGGPRDWLAFIMDRETHPALFILLMILLPMFGFPISPFLLLLGIKFGPYLAIGITTLIFAFHLALSYLLTHSFLRPQIVNLLAKTRYQIPRIQAERHLSFSILFMAVPGLPYAVKNFALAVLNIPFVIFFPVGLAANFVLALPFIGLGYSLLENPVMSLVLLAILIAGYIFALWLKRRFTVGG